MIDNVYFDIGSTNLNEIAGADDLLARWTFDDQGTNANADTSASFTHADVSAGSAMPGSGYEQLVQTNSAGTYIDSTGAGAVRPGLGSLNTDHEYWMVGDWKDGTPGGGNIAAQLITVVSVDPVGSALSGSGSLYLNSSGDIKNTLQEALDHNLGVTFSLTGNGESFSVSSLSFWLARDDNSNFRTWENWYLLASADAAFTADEVVASGTTQTSAYETWTKQTAVLDMRLPDGATRNFLLIGTCSSTEPWGRETAISDVTVEGRIYIAPGTRIIVR